MNITDVEESIPDVPMDRVIIEIFNRQLTLTMQYKEVERANGFNVPDMPLHVDDRHHQLYLKELAWRVTEELGEAWEAFVDCHFEHYFEELSDALHFMVELCLYAGIDPNHTPNIDALVELTEPVGDLRSGDAYRELISSMVDVIGTLGMSMNCLKNKPWKSSHMLTDQNKFRSLVTLTFTRLLKLMAKSGLDGGEIWAVYYKKNAVNKFRIRSRY